MRRPPTPNRNLQVLSGFSDTVTARMTHDRIGRGRRYLGRRLGAHTVLATIAALLAGVGVAAGASGGTGPGGTPTSSTTSTIPAPPSGPAFSGRGMWIWV